MSKKLFVLSGLMAFLLILGCAGTTQLPYPCNRLYERGVMRVTTRPDIELFPSVSPDGKWIAFVSCDQACETSFDIWTVSNAPGHPVRVTQTPSDELHPEWIYGRKKIIFDSDRLMGDRMIWVVHSEGAKSAMKPFSTGKYEIKPAVSPDSRKIAFVTCCVINYEFGCMSFYDPWEDDPLDPCEMIYTVNTDGSFLTQLVQGTDPAWSPDGKRLAFTANYAGNNDIYTMDANGGNLTQITFSPSDDREPCWSPDGNWIAFASDRAGNPDIWIIGADGGEMIQLTTFPSFDAAPAWSRDGYIYFHSNREQGNWDIWRLMPSVKLKEKPRTAKESALLFPSTSARIEVLNSTGVPKLAARVAQDLSDRGYNIVSIGNSKKERNLASTKIFYTSGFKTAALDVAKQIPGVQQVIKKADIRSDILVVVGEDLAKKK